MEATWRWFGPKDPVTLTDIRQCGATGIVTALHHIANGEVWPVDEIQERKSLIESSGLTWSVVESVPVHEDIKTRSGNYAHWIDNYQRTLINLANCGIDTVCYNFMPVLDWTRTDLSFELEDGSRALRFDHIAFAAFELHILQRPEAEQQYSFTERAQAKRYADNLSAAETTQLTANIIAGLPGSEEGYTLEQFQRQLDLYRDISAAKLAEHLALFLEQITPVCERHGLNLAIHPDDPPRPILGLPRVMSTIADMNWLVQRIPSRANGFTMCTGSYGVRSDNDLTQMIEAHSERIYFAHLRSTVRDAGDANSFHEAGHLEGDVDMFAVVKALLSIEQKRRKRGNNRKLPMRPDHGHQILDDLTKQTNPGYSCIGRLKGLAEVRGMERAIKRMYFSED
ncbi:MAG: mannonate dehydratase [Oceanospirillaceae bacterium]|nr:mannonate dehydratase [Oceanospirillaceae bacterium]